MAHFMIARFGLNLNSPVNVMTAISIPSFVKECRLGSLNKCYILLDKPTKFLLSVSKIFSYNCFW